MNGTVARSNGGREASAGSLRTPKRVFEAIRVEEKAEVFVLEDERVMWIDGHVFSLVLGGKREFFFSRREGRNLEED